MSARFHHLGLRVADVSAAGEVLRRLGLADADVPYDAGTHTTTVQAVPPSGLIVLTESGVDEIGIYGSDAGKDDPFDDTPLGFRVRRCADPPPSSGNATDAIGIDHIIINVSSVAEVTPGLANLGMKLDPEKSGFEFVQLAARNAFVELAPTWLELNEPLSGPSTRIGLGRPGIAGVAFAVPDLLEASARAAGRGLTVSRHFSVVARRPGSDVNYDLGRGARVIAPEFGDHVLYLFEPLGSAE